MKITSATIKNFLTLSEATISLADRGLLLIQGDNRDDSSADSNGAGKSSVVDAISWALYGVTARGVGGDAVVNRQAKKGTEVSLSLDDGAYLYVVTRKRKPNSLTVMQWKSTHPRSSLGTDLTKGTEKETQEVINRIMGCSLEVFLAAVYAGQEAMPDLPGMTDKQLKVLIEEAAGVEVLTDAYALARQRLTDATAVGAKLASVVSASQAALTMTADSLKAAQQREKDFIETNKKEVETLLQQGRNWKAKHDELAAALVKLNEPAVLARVAALNDRSKSLVAEKTKHDELVAELAAAERRLTAVMSDVNFGKRIYEQSQANLAGISSKVGTPCGTCGKPFAEHDLGEATEHAKKALEAHKSELAAAATRAKPIKDARDAAATALATYKAGMTDTTELLAAQKELAGLQADIAAMKSSVKSAQDQARAFINATSLEMKKANPYTVMVQEATEKVELLKVEIAKGQELVDAQNKLIDLTREATEVFGPAGVRAHILDTVTPFLNEKTADYLGALSDGAMTATWATLTKTAKGELRERFNIEVVNSKGADSFAGLSGGEKRKVRLACAMALQDMVATRASKPIDIFIADEVDHALDESGLERLMGVLETKARERGTVLVISHNSLSDWIDTVVTVVKDGGSSKLEGAACV